jgi:hypothetical protein
MSGDNDLYTLGLTLGAAIGFCLGIIITSLVWWLSSLLSKHENKIQEEKEI